MKIAIIGAGALGGVYATRLASVADVYLCTHHTPQAEKINRDGLHWIDIAGQAHTSFVHAVSSQDAALPLAEVIFICTKINGTREAAQTAARMLAEDGLVVTLQNGLGNLEQIAEIVGSAHVTAGTTTQAATLRDNGEIVNAGEGPTTLAPVPGFPEQKTKLAALAEVFEQASMPVQIEDNLPLVLWKKLLINVGLNALTALLRVQNGIILTEPACEVLFNQAVDEALHVAAALGIPFEHDAEVLRMRALCAQCGSNRSSKLQDILRGRATEIDAINGAVVAKGREVGVPTPVNQLLAQLIKGLEATAALRINTL